MAMAPPTLHSAVGWNFTHASKPAAVAVTAPTIHVRSSMTSDAYQEPRLCSAARSHPCVPRIARPSTRLKRWSPSAHLLVDGDVGRETVAGADVTPSTSNTCGKFFRTVPVTPARRLRLRSPWTLCAHGTRQRILPSRAVSVPSVQRSELGKHWSRVRGSNSPPHDYKLLKCPPTWCFSAH